MNWSKMTPLARKVLENEFKRSGLVLDHGLVSRDGKRRCCHGHRMIGRNVRLYKYGKTVKRVCMKCVRIRSNRRYDMQRRAR